MDYIGKLFKVFLAFLKIGAFTFGGGYAMLPLIEEEVTKRGWVKKEDIVDVFAIAQSVPGVIAVNSSIFIGYRIGGIPFAIFTTLGIVMPSFIVILAIASILIKYQDLEIIQKAFTGIRAGVTILISLAAVKLGKSVIKDGFAWLLALLSLLVVAWLEIHPVYVILAGAVSGLLYYNLLHKNTGKD